MENSVLKHITTNNLCFYYEGWRNGKKGGFVQKQGIYRFHEQVRNKSGNLNDVYDKEEDNPIVAIGIVAYWLIFNSRKDDVIKRLTRYRVEIPKDMKEQFENYTKVRFEQFKNEHRDDPNTWDWDWDYQFYARTIIPHEIGFNKQSEALFDYISDSDIALVREVMNNYIKYLKKCRTEKGFYVSPELLVLRSIDSLNKFALEDLEDDEINTILDRLENEGYVKVAWTEGHGFEDVRLLDKGRAYMKQLESKGTKSEEICITLKQQLNANSRKLKSRKVDFKPVSATFTKSGTVLTANLTLVFQFLVENKWIAQSSDPDAFTDLFLGKSSEKTIIWLKAKGVLRDLFKMFIDEDVIICPDGYTYLQIVSSHFTDKDGNYLTDLNSGYSGKKIQADLSHILMLIKARYKNEDE